MLAPAKQAAHPSAGENIDDDSTTRCAGGNQRALRERLIKAGLDPKFADLCLNMPHKIGPRSNRGGRSASPALPRDEVMLVRSGILAKFKTDGSGRRQIVALRFPGEGILPREGAADYGVQAIVRSEVLVGKAEDFDAIVEQIRSWRASSGSWSSGTNAIGYEWLVNTGRRDSTARVAHLLCETAARMGIDVRQRRHDQSLHPAADRRHHRPDLGQRQPGVRRPRAAGADQARAAAKSCSPTGTSCAASASFQPGYLQ